VYDVLRRWREAEAGAEAEAEAERRAGNRPNRRVERMAPPIGRRGGHAATRKQHEEKRRAEWSRWGDRVAGRKRERVREELSKQHQESVAGIHDRVLALRPASNRVDPCFPGAPKGIWEGESPPSPHISRSYTKSLGSFDDCGFSALSSSNAYGARLLDESSAEPRSVFVGLIESKTMSLAIMAPMVSTCGLRST